MSFHAKEFAGSHCGCRYQQDYRPTLGRDGKKESGTLEVMRYVTLNMDLEHRRGCHLCVRRVGVRHG